MTFHSAPYRSAIRNTYQGNTVEGFKVSTALGPVLIVGRNTFSLDLHCTHLICVCPFDPESTLPLDGWELVQLPLAYRPLGD